MSEWTINKDGDIEWQRDKDTLSVFVFPEGTNRSLPEAIVAGHESMMDAHNAQLDDAERERLMAALAGGAYIQDQLAAAVEALKEVRGLLVSPSYKMQIIDAALAKIGGGKSR